MSTRRDFLKQSGLHADTPDLCSLPALGACVGAAARRTFVDVTASTADAALTEGRTMASRGPVRRGAVTTVRSPDLIARLDTHAPRATAPPYINGSTIHVDRGHHRVVSLVTAAAAADAA